MSSRNATPNELGLKERFPKARVPATCDVRDMLAKPKPIFSISWSLWLSIWSALSIGSTESHGLPHASRLLLFLQRDAEFANSIVDCNDTQSVTSEANSV